MRDDTHLLDELRAVDPAHGLRVPSPALSARQLIARADEPIRTLRPSFRLRRGTLVGAVAATVAVAVLAPYWLLADRGADGPGLAAWGGRVPIEPPLAPTSFEITNNPPPAASHLEELAAHLKNAPYDGHDGRYAYRRARSWNTTVQASAEGYQFGYVEEEETWTAADGSGRRTTRDLAVTFPDKASRRFWEQHGSAALPDVPNEWVLEVPPGGAEPPGPGVPSPADWTRPPTDRAELATRLGADGGAFDAAKSTMELYRAYTVPRATRAEVLRILATVDGFVWRGRATDEAGREGVAISVDHADGARDVLIFDPRTGDLLAFEMVSPTPLSVTYVLFLAHDWTDKLG